MIYRCKYPKYYPLKKGKGFVLARTVEPQKSLGFATFQTAKQAISAGKRWYGPFLGRDSLSYIKRK